MLDPNTHTIYGMGIIVVVIAVVAYRLLKYAIGKGK